MAITYNDIVTQLKNDTHLKTGSLSDLRMSINKSVQDINSRFDLRGTKRQVRVPQGFFQDVYVIPAPSDLKGAKLIDLNPIRNRSQLSRWTLTTAEEFHRRKNQADYLVAVDQDSQLRYLLVNSFGDSQRTLVSELDAVTGDVIGTWAAANDASGLEADSWNYLTGSGSLRFDTATGAATATLTNSTLDAINLSSLKDISYGFLSLFIPDATAAAGLTSVTLDWGESSSDYFSQTVSVAHDGNAFKAGWNILSFQWLGSTETGSPTGAAVDYVKIALTKDTGLAATSDWRVDQLVFIKGELHNVSYYSKNRWKSSAGTYLENSTANTDILLVDEDEYALVYAEIAKRASLGLREKTDLEYWMNEVTKEEALQKRLRKSEALMTESSYYELEQI